MRTIERTTRFRRDYKREAKGRYRTSLHDDVVTALQSLAYDLPLAERYRDHALTNLRSIRDWRGNGYRVSLYFLSLPTPELAVARVAERVSQGGHDEPEAVVRRRFAGGLHYKLAVDDWALYDNTGTTPMLLEWAENA